MSQLLKIYKALEDEELGQRIQGAVVKRAQYLTDTQSGGSAENFAWVVLDEPFKQWIDFQVQVVTNGTVLESIIRQADGSFYSGNVSDSDIEYVVNETWGKIADKYAPVGNGSE